MRILPKVMSVLVPALLVATVALGWIAVAAMGRIGSKATQESTDALVAAERANLLAVIRDRAEDLDRFFRGYQRDVELLVAYTHWIDENPTRFDPASVPDLYPDQPHPGLPGYGYLHPELGVYADFDRRGKGCPWLPKRLAALVVQDPAVRTDVAARMHRVMLLNPLFESMGAKHRETLDLVWIVQVSGLTNVYPPYDYREIIAKDPAIMDLDENGENYVRLLDPEHNPERAIRWLEPYLDQFKWVWMTSCVAPLYTGDRFEGTLGMDILLPTVSDLVMNVDVGERGYAFLISSTGKPIAIQERGIDELLWEEGHRRTWRETFQPAGEQSWDRDQRNALDNIVLPNTPERELEPIIGAMKAGEMEVRLARIAGEEKLVAYAPVASTGWSMAAVLPVEEAAAPIRKVEDAVERATGQIAQKFLLMAVAVVLVCLGLGVYLEYRIIQPLATLTRNVERVKWEHLDFPADVKPGADEIGHLGARFGEMIRTLGEAKREIVRKTGELAQLNEALEVRVGERTAALETANRDLDAFTYSVSHDLRSPLRTLAILAQMVLEEQRTRLDEEGRQSMQRIATGAQRLQKLVDDLLAFSRLARQELSRSVVDMAAQAKEVFAELRVGHPDRDFEFTPADLPPAVGDPALLRQVWVNLLQNAVKFTRARKPAIIRVEARREADHDVYRVRDNGVGFDARGAEKMFQEFVQLHGPDEFEGIGVGLAIVKRIVDRHGGRVWAEGRVGEGAEFSFALPHADLPPPRGAGTLAEGSTGRT